MVRKIVPYAYGTYHTRMVHTIRVRYKIRIWYRTATTRSCLSNHNSVVGTRRLCWHNKVPESIEHNASIMGRTLVYYHYITEKDRYTLIEQSEKIRQLTVLLECIDLFCDMHFDNQRFRVCASATYCFPKKMQIY